MVEESNCRRNIQEQKAGKSTQRKSTHERIEQELKIRNASLTQYAHKSYGGWVECILRLKHRLSCKLLVQRENTVKMTQNDKQGESKETHTPPTKKPKPKEQNNNSEKHQTKQTNQKHTTHKTISTGQLLKENIHKINKFAARLKLNIASGHFT